MDRLSVLCFAGTYGLALGCDLARFVTRWPARWALTVILLALGWLVHTAYLLNLALREHELKIATQFDFLVVLSWMFAAMALYLMVTVPRSVAIGVFVLPMAIILSALAGLTGIRPQSPNWASWTPVWGTIHGVFLILGALFTCVAFLAGLMYLAQARRLKRKQQATKGFKLPNLEQSERLNRVAITLAFPLLTFGLLIGVLLNFEGASGGGPTVLRWSDPKILSAAIMWLIFAALLHARFRPEMRGRRVVILSMVAFGFLLFTMIGVNLLLPTEHGAFANASSPSLAEGDAP